DVGQAEAGEAVDFLLVQDAFGAALRGLRELAAVVDHGGPLFRHLVVAVAGTAASRSRGRRHGGTRITAAVFASERGAPCGGQGIVIDVALGPHREPY